MKAPDTRPAPVCQAALALAAKDVGSAKSGVKSLPTDEGKSEDADCSGTTQLSSARLR